MNRYNGNLCYEALDRGLLITYEERYTPLSIFSNAPKHIAHTPSEPSVLVAILRVIPQPKHFIIGAKNFDAWLKRCKNMPDTYACIKNRNEYILLNQGWCAHITNQQD